MTASRARAGCAISRERLCPPSRRAKAGRRGASMVEMAIVLPVFLTLVLGMLDLSIAVLRTHVLANAAREGCRKAMVHGSLSVEEWGPATFSGTADADGHPVVALVRPYLSGMDLSQVTIQVEWPEGSNGLEKPVRLTASMPYQPMMTFIFGNPTFTLRGSSTMPIVH